MIAGQGGYVDILIKGGYPLNGEVVSFVKELVIRMSGPKYRGVLVEIHTCTRVITVKRNTHKYEVGFDSLLELLTFDGISSRVVKQVDSWFGAVKVQVPQVMVAASLLPSGYLGVTIGLEQKYYALETQVRPYILEQVAKALGCATWECLKREIREGTDG